MAAGSGEYDVRCWDVTAGRVHPSSAWVGHKSVVHALAVASDGLAVLSADASGVVKCWDLRSSSCTGTMAVPTAVVHSVDFTDASGHDFAAATDEGAVFVCDLRMGRWLCGQQVHTQSCRCVDVHRPTGALAVASFDGTVSLSRWHSERVALAHGCTVEAHDKALQVQWRPGRIGARQFVTSGADRAVHLWTALGAEGGDADAGGV